MKKKCMVGLAVMTLAVVTAGSLYAKGPMPTTSQTGSGDIHMTVPSNQNLPVKSKVVEREVIFHDYDTKGGGTIYVIDDERLVMMPSKPVESWKINPLQRKDKKVKVTMSYDPDLMTYVVTDVKSK